MYCILSSSVGCLAFDHIFPHYLKSCKIFGRASLNVNRVFWFFIQILSEIFLIIRGNERQTIIMYTGVRVNYRLFLLDFNKIWIFFVNFRKIFKFDGNPSSAKTVVLCGRTDITKLIVAIFAFVNAPKWVYSCALLGCYAASSGNYYYPLRNNAEERISQQLCFIWCSRKI